MYRPLLSLFLVFLLTRAHGAEEVRKWRVKRDGRTLTLEGQYLGIRNETPQIRLTTGVILGTYQMSEFSGPDIAYMREASERMRAEAAQRQAAKAEIPRPEKKAEAPAANGAKEKERAEEKKTPSWIHGGKEELETVPGEATPEMIEAEYLRVAKKCGFEILYDPVLPAGQITGKAVTREEIKPLLGKFFSAVDIFPVRFLKNTGLNTVVFCHDLKLNDIPAGGVASGNVIYLSSSFGSHVVYHELFHVADPKRENSEWTKLNAKRFTYAGSKFAPAEGTRKELERAAASRGDEDLSKDFASDYAMSNEVEDRAETFAFMTANPKSFAERSSASPVLLKKSEQVKDIVRDFAPAMNKDFWAFIADSDDASRMDDFLNRAKLNDLRKRQKKSIINSGYKN